MRRLPPLTAVEAFVQVARLGSIKAAAAELALSSPALSRRVQALERFVGRPLFERRHQALVLNANGEQLLARIGPALDALSVAIDTTTGEHEVLRLRLSVPQLFASQQLMPRLPELRRRHAQLHIDLDTQPLAMARLGEGIDAAIVIAREVEPALYTRRIARTHIAAVGARALRDGPNAVVVPADLTGMTIFVHRDLAELFTIWRDAMGEPELEPAATDLFDSGSLMLEAAAEGLGVAFLLEEHLRTTPDERLTNLFDGEIDSGYSYWFACRRSGLATKPVRLFHDWLFEVLGDAEG